MEIIKLMQMCRMMLMKELGIYVFTFAFHPSARNLTTLLVNTSIRLPVESFLTSLGKTFCTSMSMPWADIMLYRLLQRCQVCRKEKDTLTNIERYDIHTTRNVYLTSQNTI